MKKTLLIIGLILLPLVGRAASITGYLAADCAQSNTGVKLSYCNGTYTACQTYSGVTYPNSSYKYCAPIKVGERDATSGEETYLLCFSSQTYCNQVKGCHSNYKGVKPDWLNVTMNSIGSTFTLSIYSQLKCCSSGSCVGYTYTDYHDNGVPGASLAKPNSCTSTTAETCGTTTTGQFVTCNKGYYRNSSSTAGSISVAANVNPKSAASSLKCTRCPDDDDATTSGYGAFAPPKNHCYIPSGVTRYDDNDDTYIYTSNCYYSN